MLTPAGPAGSVLHGQGTIELMTVFARRRVHVAGSEANRGIAEALGGTEFAPQGRRLSLGALDADILCQSGRQDVVEKTQRDRLERAKVELKRQFGRD